MQVQETVMIQIGRWEGQGWGGGRWATGRGRLGGGNGEEETGRGRRAGKGQEWGGVTEG